MPSTDSVWLKKAASKDKARAEWMTKPFTMSGGSYALDGFRVHIVHNAEIGDTLADRETAKVRGVLSDHRREWHTGTTATISVYHWRQALKAALAYTKRGAKDVTLAFHTGALEVYAKNAETGAMHWTLADGLDWRRGTKTLRMTYRYTGDAATVRLNARYLNELLMGFDGEVQVVVGPASLNVQAGDREAILMYMRPGLESGNQVPSLKSEEDAEWNAARAATLENLEAIAEALPDAEPEPIAEPEPEPEPDAETFYSDPERRPDTLDEPDYTPAGTDESGDSLPPSPVIAMDRVPCFECGTPVHIARAAFIHPNLVTRTPAPDVTSVLVCPGCRDRLTAPEPIAEPEPEPAGEPADEGNAETYADLGWNPEAWRDAEPEPICDQCNQPAERLHQVNGAELCESCYLAEPEDPAPFVWPAELAPKPEPRAGAGAGAGAGAHRRPGAPGRRDGRRPHPGPC